MGSYELRWKRSAVQDLRKIDRSRIPKVLESVEALTHDPQPEGCRRLKGTRRQFRIRIGDHRVIYEVDHENREITVHYIRHRKDAYRS